MKTQHGKKYSGFSVMELMIVIVIIAILVSLAFPSYIQYVRKSKRGEAQQLLMNWSINQEIWRSNNVQYATTAQLVQPTNDHYAFTLPTRSATAYTVQAAASGDQVKDQAKDGTSCTPLTLDQSGLKLPAVCWD
jgi:type IV pilus assembly protein PilE